MRREIALRLVGWVILLLGSHLAMAQQLPFPKHTEELQGTIYMVEPESGLLILEKNRVTYSFQVVPATRIWVNSQARSMETLSVWKGQRATVVFRSTYDGNIAQEITVFTSG